MSELGLDSRYNLVDALKLTRNNKYVGFANVLTETNDMLMDLPLTPANGVLSHEDARLTSIPTPQIIRVGDGWDAQVAQWDNFKETISLFKDRLDIPEDVYDLQANPMQWRADCEDAHAEGFGQGVANHIIYGDSAAAPEKFDGFGVRYKTPDANDPLNPSSSGNANVFDAGGTGSDTTSIWLVQWGYNKVFGITPANDPNMGLKRMDIGRVQVTAENSKTRNDLRTEFDWKLGLCVKDVRAVARIRNIESAITSIDATLIDKIIQARGEVFRGSEPVFMYCNRRVKTLLKLLTKDKQNIQFDSNNPYAIPAERFDDMMLRTCDAILNTETAVAAA